MGYEKEAYLYLLFHYTGKKDFSREHTKNPNANDRARPEVTFWAVGYHSPPSPSQLFTYIMSNMRTHLSAKGLVGTRGGTMF